VYEIILIFLRERERERERGCERIFSVFLLLESRCVELFLEREIIIYIQYIE
jgi:hypothetical protein